MADAQGPKPSNYDAYVKAEFNRPDFYPIEQTLDARLYRPLAPWMGRLILPAEDQRAIVDGVLFEVHHAPEAHRALMGHTIYLRWAKDDTTQRRVARSRYTVRFGSDAEQSRNAGQIVPTRLDGWADVDPLESLAANHPLDDILVYLEEPSLEPGAFDRPAALYIHHDPIQISAPYYALVRIEGRDAPDSDLFRVTHYNRASGQFDGLQETLRFPDVVRDMNTVRNSTMDDIEKSPANPGGWYVYGAQDHKGQFTVRALAPRDLLALRTGQVIVDPDAGRRYIMKRLWDDTEQKKGQIETTLVAPGLAGATAALAAWQEGERGLLLHVYGGIGGQKTEPAAKFFVFWGHFAYGFADVVREPLTDELRFDIVYHQVYAQNVDGVIAGAIHWSHYLGDRQFGWLGTRPVADTIVRLPGLTETYTSNLGDWNPLDTIRDNLEIITARYRVGDGSGATFATAAYSCSQDASQAMFDAITQVEDRIIEDPAPFVALTMDRAQATRLQDLMGVQHNIKDKMSFLWKTRQDWKDDPEVYGKGFDDGAVRNFLTGLGSFRMMLPPVAYRSIMDVLLKYHAQAFVLRTNQVGGWDPEIAPVAPNV